MDEEVTIFEKFTVICKKCGSAEIELDDTRGRSDASGGWGGVTLTCLHCNESEEIVEIYD